MYAVVDTTNSDFSRHWNRLLATDPLQNPLYAPPRQRTAWEETEFSDRSFLVLSEDEPVFGCSLTLHTDAHGRRCLGYFGIEASTLVNRHSMEQPTNNFRPEAIRLLQAHFSRLIEELQPDALDYFDPGACGLMSPVTQVLLERGGIPIVYRASNISLLSTVEMLRAGVSESYRELIDWGNSALIFTFTAGVDVDEVPTRIPALLAEGGDNAARATLAHWHTCRELVRGGNGFILQAAQPGAATVSALFAHNDTTCHYVIDDAALDTTPRPVMHSVIWQAMVRSKQLGCTRFDLGCVTRPGHGPEDNQTGIDPAQFGGTPQTRMKVTLQQ